MRADLDRLMEEYKLDALMILGDKAPNPYRDYLTRRSKAVGHIIKKRGETPIFIVGGMEIDEAQKSGLKVMNTFEFDYAALYRAYGDQPAVFQRELFLNYFRKLGVTGRVGFYGVADVGMTLENAAHLEDSTLQIEIVVGGPSSELFSRAYQTKDEEELAALRESARLTSLITRHTWEYISGHYAKGEDIGSLIVDADGSPLTVGAVKRFIRTQLFDYDMDDPTGTIFAQGRDAGIPHNHGEDDDILEVGRSIVFDFYPRGLESGYFHDMTRTWCVHRAPDDVQAAYDDVMTVFNRVKAAYKVGDTTSKYQIIALDYFESKGHATPRSRPGTMDGYVHSLGHGLGLNIHESPRFGERSTDQVTPGNVFTVEPGLYYPERGFGVRVEDTVYVDESGQIQTLTDFPYDLVVPIKGIKR